MSFQKGLKEFVQNNPNLVTKKQIGDDMFVLKYKKKVFFDNLWNKYLEECRGTIVDSDFNLISYPFTKIYNYGIEENAPILLEGIHRVDAMPKINGFMVAVTCHKGDLIVSTTGSVNSKYVDMAKEYIPVLSDDIKNNFLEYNTVLFECCHPDDPHIIPETPGLYVIGYRKKEYGSPIRYDLDTFHEVAVDFEAYFMPAWKNAKIEDVLIAAKQAKHEGYVFYTEDGRAAKIKSPFYLTSKWMARNPKTDKLLTKGFREKIDEEFYPLLDHIKTNIDLFTSMDEQSRLRYIREFLEK